MMYVVRKNDTLSTIAKKFNTTVDSLVAFNNIENPDLIKYGQVLHLPDIYTSDEVRNCLNECISDIEKLPSYKKLMEMLK